MRIFSAIAALAILAGVTAGVYLVTDIIRKEYDDDRRFMDKDENAASPV